MTPTTEILGRYGPATAKIERLTARLENLTHADWRGVVAGQAHHPPSDADQQRLANAMAAAQVGREAESAVAMIKDVVAAASVEVSMDPALDPMPVAQADLVMSDVVRALAAGNELEFASLAAFYAPLQALVPLSQLSAAAGYGPTGQAAVAFIEDLASLSRAGWRRVEARRLSESRDASTRGAASAQALLAAALACRQGDQEAWVAASADARAAAARSWDLCHTDDRDAGERHGALRRAQLAGGCLAVRDDLPEGTCEILCSLFTGIVDLPKDLAKATRHKDDKLKRRLFVRASQELRVPYGVLEATLRMPEQFWAVMVGSREHGGQPNLEVGFGSGPTRLRHRVALEVGEVITGRRQTVFSIKWEPVAEAHIVPLPGFDGRLVVRGRDASGSEIIIEGDYLPPLGKLGRLLDQRLVHRVAEATLADLVTRVVAALVEA